MLDYNIQNQQYSLQNSSSWEHLNVFGCQNFSLSLDRPIRLCKSVRPASHHKLCWAKRCVNLALRRFLLAKRADIAKSTCLAHILTSGLTGFEWDSSVRVQREVSISMYLGPLGFQRSFQRLNCSYWLSYISLASSNDVLGHLTG